MKDEGEKTFNSLHIRCSMLNVDVHLFAEQKRRTSNIECSMKRGHPSIFRRVVESRCDADAAAHRRGGGGDRAGDASGIIPSAGGVSLICLVSPTNLAPVPNAGRN